MSGDFVDLHAFTLKYMDHSVLGLTQMQVGFVPHEALMRITEQSPHLTRLFWTLTTVDGAIHRTMIASLGRRGALQRLGHLLCELNARLSAIGNVLEHSFDIPITQEDLADILGLSSVHMNRTIQELRQSHLISWQGSRVTITDLAKLKQMSGYDGRYLSLVRRNR
jgi:CRP-like cAMP-binding protein